VRSQGTDRATVAREARILSSDDLGAIAEALSESREAIVCLMAEFDALRNDLHTNPLDAFETLARLSTAVTTIRDRINSPGGRFAS
jgi:hypothetical protein